MYTGKEFVICNSKNEGFHFLIVKRYQIKIEIVFKIYTCLHNTRAHTNGLKTN